MSEEAAALIPLVLGVLMVPLVMVPLTRMAADGELGPNSAAGIRTRHTCASPEAWIAGHAAALPRLKATVPVALLTAGSSIAAQVVGGGAWGVGVGLAGLLVELAVVVSALGPANAAARAAKADHRG